jgi:hypothetical protein
MFSDIINDASDHWNPMSDNPIIPEHMNEEVQEVNPVGDDEEDQEIPREETNEEGQEVREVPRSIGIGKRRSRAVNEKGKKPKIGTSLVIQEQITKIADSASSFTSKKSSEVTVQQIMDLVVECGAHYGSDEHFIATELFVKKDQRDMFMTLPDNEFRFNWLKRKYNRDPNFIPTIPERYNKYAVPRSASDESTPERNAVTMDVFRDELATTVSVSWR